MSALIGASAVAAALGAGEDLVRGGAGDDWTVRGKDNGSTASPAATWFASRLAGQQNSEA